ncbi:hypothetical protein [uncultured Clostridium sp.]|uniref:hypothetical protein n=1 Tax=uncultured Clostridium sp. TaxID=59620 RepID=UPI0026F08B3C|nr:hypothetical protein [uncultured Clostridium sp.]
MGKVKFEFDAIEEQNDIALCTNRYKLASMLSNISDYRRTLYKWEEREQIPTEEIVNKLDDLLSDWYYIDNL